MLVVGPSWVGDMVMAQALYKLLRQQSPTAEIHVVAPPWSLPVLARMPEVARGIELDVGHGELGSAAGATLGAAAARASATRARSCCRVRRKPRSCHGSRRVPRRTGFRGEWRYGLLNDVRSLDPGLDQTVKRFVALGQPRGAEPPRVAAARRCGRGSPAIPHNLERLRATHSAAPRRSRSSH